MNYNCRVSNVARAPLVDRFMVVDPAAHAELIQVENFSKVNEAGMSGTLREASLGRIYGVDAFLNQNIVSHTKGDVASTAALSGASGAFTGTIASGGSAKIARRGDLFSIADVSGQFVVTEDMTTESDGTGILKFYPALPSAVSGKVITVVASHTANLLFSKSAFCLVTRPLAPAQGAESATVNFEGLPLRVTKSWDADHKVQRVAFDLLYGVKTLYPELAVRMLG